MKSLNKPLIVLDAGHDETKPWKRSPDRTGPLQFSEWLQNRLFVRELSRSLAGFGLDAVETAPGKEKTTLIQRRKIADFWACQGYDIIMISLHSNAAGKGGWKKAHGAVIFTTTDPSEESTILAQRLYWVYKQLAIETRDIYNGPVKRNVSSILRPPKGGAPWYASALIERGFHTNKVDVKLMLDKSYIKQEVCCVVGAIKRYLLESLILF